MENNEVKRRISFELRDFRDVEARKKGVESYKVLQNETIDQIAESLPKTNLELLDIKGIGPHKSKMYGATILRIVEEAEEETPVKEKSNKSTDKIYSVGEFLDILNKALAAKTVSVEGEITQINKRGLNYYFSIKDKNDEAVLNCFARDYVLPAHDILEAGHEIVVMGFPSIYKPYGRFSLHVDEVLLSGEGLLRRAYEELMKKLKQEGLFDKERKRPIDSFVRNVGLITAKDSQAEKDFSKNIGEYGFKISHFDVRVQGAQSVGQIVGALKWFNTHSPETEVIVLTRGGGSLEDLQAFNSEEVARAIYSSKIPVVVGVGHEGDVSIADMVADVRVSTPTAAAEILSYDWKRAGASLDSFMSGFTHTMTRKVEEVYSVYAHIGDALSYKVEKILQGVVNNLREAYTSIHNGTTRTFDGLRRLEERFNVSTFSFVQAIAVQKKNVSYEEETLKERTSFYLKSFSSRLLEVEKILEVANPNLKLKQGYSIAFDSKGKVLKSVKNVSKGEHITTKVSDGDIKSTVD